MTLPDQRVRRLSSLYECVQLEFSTHRETRERLGVYGTPVMLVLDAEGEVIDQLDGFVTADELVPWLTRHARAGRAKKPEPRERSRRRH